MPRFACATLLIEHYGPETVGIVSLGKVATDRECPFEPWLPRRNVAAEPEAPPHHEVGKGVVLIKLNTSLSHGDGVLLTANQVLPVIAIEYGLKQRKGKAGIGASKIRLELDRSFEIPDGQCIVPAVKPVHVHQTQVIVRPGIEITGVQVLSFCRLRCRYTQL